MKPKNIPYGRQTIEAADVRAVVAALRSGWLSQGPRIAEFEERVARACGAKHAVACSSGTAALHLACLAAGLGPGDEAIVPTLTFSATANAVAYCGAAPVFADVQADTVNLDPAGAEAAVTPRTKALLAVHFMGHPAELIPLADLAKRKRLVLIEDAAHALGALYRGEPVGSCLRSDMTTLSFHPVKHITTGEGGMVLTNRAELADRVRMLRNHGITRDAARLREHHGPWYMELQALGFNYRITDLQAALGTAQLKRLPAWVERRRGVAAEYDAAFSKLPELILPVERGYVRHSWHLYVIRLKDPALRRPVFEALRRRGIEVNVHYVPVHRMPYYQDRGWAGKSFPNADAYYAGAITLPMFPALKGPDIRRVVKAVEDSLAEALRSREASPA